MDASLISAGSALAGTAVGGTLSFVASWFVNQRQVRWQWLTHDRERREEVYKEFIEEAAKCYIDALLHDKPDVQSMIVLYGKLSRIRVLSAPRVVQSADRLLTTILATYSLPNKSVSDIEAIKDGSLDVLREFSEAARSEFDSLRARL